MDKVQIYTLLSDLTDVEVIDQSKKLLLTNQWNFQFQHRSEWFCLVNLAKQNNVVILFFILIKGPIPSISVVHFTS